MTIREYEERDREQVIELVLHCQNDGTRPFKSVKDQPELLEIQEKYRKNGGNFWVAVDEGRVAGSIGLMNYGNGFGILKKFFVYEAYRGAPTHLGRQLFKVLIDFAKSRGFKTIFLDTPTNTSRAHKFYEKAGFEKIEQSELPFRYEYPYAESDFFKLEL